MAAKSPESNPVPGSREELLLRIHQLEERLVDSEETLRAIRNGEVDGIVVTGPQGDQVYTLKGADETYRQMVEEMAEGALTLAPDGLILFANERFAKLLGTSLEEVIGSDLRAFIAAEDSNVLAALSSPAVQDGKAEVSLLPPDRPAIPAYLSWKRANQDGLECVSVIVTDLSEQRRTEEIASAERLARSILEQAAEAMLVIDLAGKIIRASHAADRLAGTPVLLRRFDEVFQLYHAAGSRRFSFSEVLARTNQRPPEYIEITSLMPDGRTFQLFLTSAPLTNPIGELLGCIVSLVDITERKRAEKILIETTEELRASNQALLRSNEDLERFAYIASHDLQEPLRIVTAYSQLLMKAYGDCGESEAHLYVDNIVESTKRMRELISDLLAFMQLRGKDEKPLERVDLDSILETVKLNLKAAIEDSAGAITADPLPVVSGHPPHLVTLFQNLIGNAIKYHGEEPPRVHISVQETPGELRFAVRDNGIGIEPEYHDKIFVAFKRLHGKAIPGSGIGLAICQRVVERYGGRIWVESELGHGATFYFTLPQGDELQN